MYSQYKQNKQLNFFLLDYHSVFGDAVNSQILFRLEMFAAHVAFELPWLVARVSGVIVEVEIGAETFSAASTHGISH